jgi:integrase
MTRPRKIDRHLPQCVYLKHGAYWLVKKGRWERLGSDLPSALAEYGRRLSEPSSGMADLIDTALATMKSKIASTTWTQYQTAARKLKHVFAEFSPEQVKPKHVAQMKISMSETPNMCNRCLSVLRQVFDYALEQQLVESNPAIGVKRHHENKRKRLISPEEYAAIHAQAGPRLQIIMDLLYLTGQRVTDFLTIRYIDLREDGIYFEQDKTDARLIVRWSPELRVAVDRAKALHGNLRALTLLHNRRGKAPDYRTIRDQWDKACAGAGVADADLRDLRAMSGTAAKAQGWNPTALLGHTSPAMTVRYLRDKEVPVVDGPTFRQVLDVRQTS